MTASSWRNGRLLTGAFQFGTEMAAPDTNIEDPIRHRSQELHQSANGSRANRRLAIRDGSPGRPPAGRDRETSWQAGQNKNVLYGTGGRKGTPPPVGRRARVEASRSQRNEISLDSEGPSHGSRERKRVAELRTPAALQRRQLVAVRRAALSRSRLCAGGGAQGAITADYRRCEIGRACRGGIHAGIRGASVH